MWEGQEWVKYNSQEIKELGDWGEGLGEFWYVGDEAKRENKTGKNESEQDGAMSGNLKGRSIF